jgi:hypothetical protein
MFCPKICQLFNARTDKPKRLTCKFIHVVCWGYCRRTAVEILMDNNNIGPRSVRKSFLKCHLLSADVKGGACKSSYSLLTIFLLHNLEFYGVEIQGDRECWIWKDMKRSHSDNTNISLAWVKEVINNLRNFWRYPDRDSKSVHLWRKTVAPTVRQQFHPI